MELSDVRNTINEIDDDMKTLYKKRLECSKKVAQIKLCSNDEVFKPEREREIEKRLGDDKGYLAYIKKVIQISRKAQYKEFIASGKDEAGFKEWLEDNNSENEKVFEDGGILKLVLRSDECGMKALSVNDIISVIADSGLRILKLTCDGSSSAVGVELMVENNDIDKKEAYILSYMLYKEAVW